MPVLKRDFRWGPTERTLKPAPKWAGSGSRPFPSFSTNYGESTVPHVATLPSPSFSTNQVLTQLCLAALLLD